MQASSRYDLTEQALTGSKIRFAGFLRGCSVLCRSVFLSNCTFVFGVRRAAGGRPACLHVPNNDLICLHCVL